MPIVISNKTALTGDPTPVPFPMALGDMSNGGGTGPWANITVIIDPVANTQITPAKDGTVAAFGGTTGSPSAQIQTIQGNASGVPVPMVRGGAQVTVTPTVTAGSYSSGNVMGGIMTFANILPGSLKAELRSITLTFKATTQTVEFDVAIFSASPTGTFADHGAPAIASTDSSLLLGIYKLVNNFNTLGTHTIYNIDGIGKQLIGTTTSLYAVVTAKSAPVNPASTSEMSLTLSTLW